MSNELQVTGPVFVASRDLTPELKATIRATVFPDSTDAEMVLYLHDCERNLVHPLDRMIHPQIRNKDNPTKRRYVGVTSIDLFRSRAGDTGQHSGTDDAVFIDGNDGPCPVLASVTVYRAIDGVRCPFTASARWSEYYPGEGWVGEMWRKMPNTMLAKCAEGLALRKAFPRQLAGLYTVDEMDQAGDSAKPLPAGKVTPRPAAKAVAQQEQRRAAAEKSVAEVLETKVGGAPADDAGTKDGTPAGTWAERLEAGGVPAMTMLLRALAYAAKGERVFCGEKNERWFLKDEALGAAAGLKQAEYLDNLHAGKRGPDVWKRLCVAITNVAGEYGIQEGPEGGLAL